MASSTASETMRFTVLETRVVARLSSSGCIWVVARKSMVSASTMAAKSSTRASARRAVCLR